jgi:DNA-directed RNA polymerase specialized sigma24 family protein
MAEQPLSPDARTLAADLFEQHAANVAARLAARCPAVDPQLIADAVVRAILDVSAVPRRHDAGRGSLRTFLTGAASRALRDTLRSQRRRQRRYQKKAIDPVTATASAARSLLDELADRELVGRVRASLSLTPEEGRALDLWLLGATDPAAFVTALGLTGLPPAEREEAGRRVLDRLRQRIHRLKERFRQEGRGP